MQTLFDLVYQPIGGFIIVFLGIMFLFAEVLVKGRFLFGLLGLAAFSLYFYVHMQETQTIWMGLTFIAGIVLVVLDGKFIGDGTLGGVGALLMIVSLAIPSPSLFYGIAVVVAFVLGIGASLFFPKFVPRREVWSKLVLKDTLSAEQGYNSMNSEYISLIGQKGVAETDFRPTGMLKLGDKVYSAVSEGRWISKGTSIEVFQVSGVRILVKPVADDEHNKN